MKYFLLILLLKATLLCGISPQDFAVDLTSEPSSLSLGNQIHLKATFKFPSNYKMDTDALIDQLLWTANPTLPQYTLNRYAFTPDRHHFEGVLEPLQTGPHSLTFIHVTFTPINSGLESVTVSSPILHIEVQPPQETAQLKTASFHPLDPEMPFKMTRENRLTFVDDPQMIAHEAKRNSRLIARHSFPWTFLILSLVVLLGVWGFKRMYDRFLEKQRAALEASSAYLKAQQSLEVLKSQNLISQGRYKEYFSEITSILQNYLQKRFQLNWSHYTTSELAQFQSTSDFEILLKNKLIRLYTIADQVKFAGSTPSSSNCLEALNIAEEIIT